MSKKPNIILSSQDLDRLEALLDALPMNAFPGKAALQEELDRADVVEPQQILPTVVTMNSIVRFAIESSDEEFCLTLADASLPEGYRRHRRPNFGAGASR